MKFFCTNEDKTLATYCLICSAARSGSTLLDMVIGSQQSAASLGEFSFLGKALALNQKCTCGETVCDCPAWKMIFDSVLHDRNIDLRKTPYALRQWDTHAVAVIDKSQQTFKYLLSAKLRRLQCDIKFLMPKNSLIKLRLPQVLREGAENTIYLYEKIASLWNKNVIVDSSKNITKALALHEYAPDKVKIIFLTRDGRGVFYSKCSSRLSRGLSFRQALNGWSRYNTRALSLLEKNLKNNQYLQIKYEDLAANPTETLRHICNFLEMPYEKDLIGLSEVERHMVNGNATRFRPNQSIQLDERWKTGLVGKEMEYFMARGSKLNARLGYE